MFAKGLKTIFQVLLWENGVCTPPRITVVLVRTGVTGTHGTAEAGSGGDGLRAFLS